MGLRLLSAADDVFEVTIFGTQNHRNPSSVGLRVRGLM